MNATRHLTNFDALCSEDADLRIRGANPQVALRCADFASQSLHSTEDRDPKTGHACSEDGDLRIRMANPWSRVCAAKIADKAQRVALPTASGTLVWYFAASLFRFKHVYERPHSSLGDVPPAAFRSEFEARSREKRLRFSGCSPILAAGSVAPDGTLDLLPDTQRIWVVRAISCRQDWLFL
jgi:hypothetical protein